MFYKLRLQIQRIEGALYFKIAPLTPPTVSISASGYVCIVCRLARYQQRLLKAEYIGQVTVRSKSPFYTFSSVA